MDRLFLKCAIMDLMDHDLVVLESKEDAAEVVAAAKKLGFEVSADPRSQGGSEDSWVITTHRRHDEPKPAVAVDAGGTSERLSGSNF